MRECHPSPLPQPPPGHQWQPTLGADGIGLVLLRDNEIVTSAQHRVDAWSDMDRHNIIDNLVILAHTILDWLQIRDDLLDVGIDVILEAKVGVKRDRYTSGTD
jgi:hypothetical protein